MNPKSKASAASGRKLVLLAIGATVTSAAAVRASTYDTAVNNLNPVTYFKFETPNATADSDTSVAAGTNALSNYTVKGISSAASSTASTGGMFGTPSMYNSADGYTGFDATNNVAQYASANLSFSSSVTPDGTTGIANAAAFRTATGTAGLTFSTWARVDTLPTGTALPTLAAVIVGTSGNQGATTGFQVNFTSTGIRVGGRSVSTDTFQQLVVPYATAGYTAGQLANIVGVADYGGKTLTLFVNGVQVGQATGLAFANSALTYGTGTSSGIVSMGGIFNSLNTANTGNSTTAGSQLFTGIEDMSAFYNRALTASEVTGLYTAAGVTPEPASLALIGCVGVAALRRRGR